MNNVLVTLAYIVGLLIVFALVIGGLLWWLGRTEDTYPFGLSRWERWREERAARREREERS